VPLPHGLAMVQWTEDFERFSLIALMASFVLVGFIT